MNSIDVKKIAALCAVKGLKAEINLEGVILRGKIIDQGKVQARAARVVSWEDLAEDPVGVIESESDRIRKELINHLKWSARKRKPLYAAPAA